ncbi:MAG: SDR family oxidoreductase [Bacteroidales bacterium]|jgi:3-oxoacyl-[acyl-carrier protein] reductase|nr:SDR family oxidoreductase [Bacteroidales bacterium]
MDLKIENQNFIVTGVTSGFGRSVAEQLINKGANVIGVARRVELLNEMKNSFRDQFDFLVMDITHEDSVNLLIEKIGDTKISGIFVNAGGPPAKSFLETQMDDWDNAYEKLLRWKVDMVMQLIPSLVDHNYGRILFLESSSVKQPIENLVLSTSLRLAVVGMAKTLSEELSIQGITVNVLAPGSHNTSALDRLIQKKSEMESSSFENAKKEFENNTKVGFLGDPDDLASIAVWLLSPQSKFVTGQTISIAGGAIRNIFG